MDPQLQFKLQLYKNQPNYFNDDELDVLKTQLTDAGVDKSVLDNIGHATNGRDSDFSLGRSIANFVEGTFEGATTLDTEFVKPQNTADKISRSIGELGGFVGSFFLPVGYLAKGLGFAAKGAKAANMGKVASGLGRAKNVLETSKYTGFMRDDKGNLINAIPVPSVPQRGSKLVQDTYKKYIGPTKMGEYLKSISWLQKDVPSKIIHEGINLGIMSGISTIGINPMQWSERNDDLMESIISGGIAGSAFGGIGQIQLARALRSNSKAVREGAEKTVKAIAGATVQGLMMNSHIPEGVEIPTEEWVYELLLGGYFGFNAISAKKMAVEQNRGKVEIAAEKDVPFKDVIPKDSVTKEVEKELAGIYENSAAYKKIIELVRNKNKDAMSFVNNYNDVKITGGPNQGKEGKIVFSDPAKPNRVEVFFPNENRYTHVAPKNMEFKKSNEDKYVKGENYFERKAKEDLDAYNNLESFESNVMQPNKNVETAAFALTNASARSETPMHRRAVIERLNESLEGKTEKDFNIVIKDLESAFPGANNLEKQKVKDSIKRYLKSNENLTPVNTYTVDFNNNLSIEGYLNAEGRPNTRKAKNVKWTDGEYTYNEITGREGIVINKKNNKVKGVVSKLFRENKDLFNNDIWKKSKISKKDFNYEQGRNDFIKRQQQLWQEGKFSLGGVGEKERIVFTDLKKKVKALPKEILKDPQFTENRKNWVAYNKAYNADKKTDNIKFPKSVKNLDTFLKKQYNTIVANKIAWIEHLNAGKSFSDMVKANKKAERLEETIPYITDVVNLNKRLPVIHASEPAWRAESFSKIKGIENNNLKVLLSNGIPKGPAAKKEYIPIVSKALKKEMDNHVDGIYMLRSDVFDAFIADGGLPSNVGSGKGTLLTASKDKGLMLGKYAYHRASKEMSSLMEKDGYHGELVDLSIKQLGERNLYDVTWKNGKQVYRDKKGRIISEKNLDAIFERIPIKDHRTNLGVYENPVNNLSNSTSALQRWEWNFNEFIGKAKIKEMVDGKLVERPVNHNDVRSAFDKLTERNFSGDPSINEVLVKKNKEWTSQDVEKIKATKLEEMGVNEVLDISNSNIDSPGYRMIWEKLLRRFDNIKDLASDHVIDTKTMDQISDILGRKSTADGILNFAELTPDIINHKWTWRYTRLVQRNYILNKVNKPLEENSSKHILMPYTREMQANPETAGLKPGEAFAYKNNKDLMVFVDNRAVSLENAIKDRDSLILQKKNFTKGTKKENTDLDTKIQKYEDALNVVVLRVPADNISGQRLIRIKKILDEKGTGLILHPEDMHYAGGADLDIDSVFMYRNTPKFLKDAIELNKHIMKDNDPTGSNAQLTFGTGELLGKPNALVKKSAANMLDPLFTEMVGKNAKVNNNNLGVAVNDGQLLGRAIDHVKTYPKKEYIVNVNGENHKIKISIAKGKNMLDFSKKVQQAVNMYADAGKFGTLKSRDALLELMLKESGIKITPIDGPIKDARGNALSEKQLFDLSPFKAMNDFKQALKGVRYEDNNKIQMELSEVKASANKLINVLEANKMSNEISGTLLSKAKRLVAFNDPSNAFMHNIDPGNYVKAIRNINKTVKEEFKDHPAIIKLLETWDKAVFPTVGKQAKDARTQSEMYSNDLDYLTTVLKMKKNLKAIGDIAKQNGKKVDSFLEEIITSAAEGQTYWQLEKNENFDRKMHSSNGKLELADHVRGLIKIYADQFKKDFIGDKRFDSKTQQRLGKIKEELYYDALGSNVMMGVNHVKDVVYKGRTLNTNVLRGRENAKANIDMMYTLDSIPPKYLIKHFELRQRVADSLRRNIEDPVDLIMSDEPILKGELKDARELRKDRRNAILGYKEGMRRAQYLERIKSEIPDSPELRTLAEDVNAIFEKDGRILEHFESIFPSITGRPYASKLVDFPIGVDFNNASVKDIKNFVGYFKRKMSPEDWVKYKKDENLELKLGMAEYFKFPETVTDRVGPFDIHMFGPVKGKKIKDGKIVDAELMIPMSRFERLTRDNNSSSERATALIDQFNQNLISPRFDWLNSIKDKDMIRPIEEATWGLVEKDYQGSNQKTYIDGYAKYTSLIKKHGNDKFTIKRGDKAKEYTVKQIIDMHAKEYRKLMKEVNDNILHSEVEFYSSKPGEGFLIKDSDGVINIGETISRRVQPLLRQIKENIGENGKFNTDRTVSNDNLFKTMELWHKLERATKRDGEIVLYDDLAYMGDKYRGEFAEYTMKAIKDINANKALGSIDGGHYLPHLNIPKAVKEAYIKKAMEKKTIKGSLEELVNQDLNFSALGYSDGGFMKPFQNVILHQNDRGRHRLIEPTRPAHTKTGNQRHRSADLPGYTKDINTVTQYAQQLLKARYNAIMALSNRNTIRNFESSLDNKGRPLMGSKENQEHWGRFMKLMSLKDSGGAHILPEHWLSDKKFKINPFYFTEGGAFKKLRKMGEFFNKPDLFLDGIGATEKNLIKTVDKNGKSVYKIDKVATPAALADRLNWLSNLEARISTSTLLMNTRGVTYNLVGGHVGTIINAGLRPWRKSFDYKHLRNVIPDTSNTKGPDTRGRDWFINWAKKHGVIETFWTSEMAGNLAFRGKDGISKSSLMEAYEAAVGKPQKEAKRSFFEVLKKHGYDAKFSEMSGWFMKTAEVELRLRSFLAHYLKSREVFAARGTTFKADDPALIKMALDGVTGSQFLYNNTARPVATASPIGRIFSRFQLWTANSIRMRKDISTMARDQGFKEGTEEYDKYNRMLAADMFMFGMASLLPYSMFDATLPPPYNYYQEISQVMYGTPQEKERAFFGTLPYPLNVTGLITPPSGRYITQPLGNLMTGDWDRFWDYQIYNWFPGGMLFKTAKDVVEQPIKAVDKITGFPLYRINYMSKDKEEENS
jgi:hypothetical protein